MEDLISITGGPLRPHEYILIKSRMTAGDARFIQNRLASTRNTESGKPEVVLTLGDSQFATCLRLVKGWQLYRSVKGLDGEAREVPIPFDAVQLEKCLEDLDEEIYTYLLEEINKKNAKQGGSESDKDFQLAVIDSSEGSLNAERVLHLKH